MSFIPQPVASLPHLTQSKNTLTNMTLTEALDSTDKAWEEHTKSEAYNKFITALKPSYAEKMGYFLGIDVGAATTKASF
jgi:activator of 2-hydroxyglutaryl-CoA dehydratase